MASNPRESLRRENISRIDSKNRQSRENGSKCSLAFEEISRQNGGQWFANVLCGLEKKRKSMGKLNFKILD